jgi:hypothetical protein
MGELVFLLIAAAFISALAGGYLKQFWPLALGIVLLCLAFVLTRVRL